MLDRELCERFQVKPFMEWIQNELDDLEDQLYNGPIETSTEYAAIATRYNTLIQVRDKYAQLHKN